MANLKLTIEEFEEEDFIIIAIITPLEDYRLAYFLNLNLDIFLGKNKNDVELIDKEGNTLFTRFTFEDKINFVSWNLIQNKNKIEIEKSNSSQDLFSGYNTKFSINTYLLSEYKKVDYFLKIENAEQQIKKSEIVSKINKIENIKMVFSINSEKMKSKNNLIL